ncbi:arsenate reductase/protein-tyrosine-phosphatase family protein [Streptomyces coffeae]
MALTRRGGTAVTVRSAGLISKWRDQPANPSMINAARRLGYDLNPHRARQITLEMLDWADIVLTMDSAVLETLRAICGGQRTQARSLPRRPRRPRPDGPG